MRHKSQADPVHGRIAALAARQHGVVSLAQLIQLGLSRQSVYRRARLGQLHRIHQGVYAVGHKRLTQRGRWMAAVLAGGPGAVLSHRSAAVFCGILPARGPVHVTTGRELRNRDGIHFHSQSLQFDEVTEHDGIPTTTVARTLFDIAATEPESIERAFNEAEYLRLWDATGVADLVARYARRPGSAALAELLVHRPMGRTREELENRFQALVEEGALPRPRRNQDMELSPGYWIQPDCVWPDARLIVELDSRAAHGTTSRFDSDRERDRLLALAGWTVIRVTWKHVTKDAPRL